MGVIESLRDTSVLTSRELRKWMRSKGLIIMAMTMPLMWLLLFGQAFRLDNLIPDPSMIQAFLTGAPNYFSYMAIGMVCVIALITSMQCGMSLIWDRQFGFLSKLQAAPLNREVIPISRIASGVIKSLVIGSVTLFIAIAIGVVPGLEGLTLGSGYGVLEFLITLLIILLLALGFGSLFTTISIRMTNTEMLMSVINLVNMPIMFASAALYPVAMMPDWMATIAKYNPLTLAVDGIRQLAFDGSDSIHSLGVDILALLIFAGIMVIICIVISRRALASK